MRQPDRLPDSLLLFPEPIEVRVGRSKTSPSLLDHPPSLVHPWLASGLQMAHGEGFAYPLQLFVIVCRARDLLLCCSLFACQFHRRCRADEHLESCARSAETLQASMPRAVPSH